MAAKLPPIEELPNLTPETRNHTLDLLFEPSPALHALASPLLTTQTFPSYTTLITAIQTHLLTLLTSPPDLSRLDSILGSHPRLGAKKVESAQSTAEQAKLQQGSAEEAEKLRVLNEEYEARFPGLRYVVFVNGRGREEIMRDMRARIDEGDIGRERERAVEVSELDSCVQRFRRGESRWLVWPC